MNYLIAFVLVLALGGLAVARSASAQTILTKPTTTLAYCGDKVSVSGFSITPAQPAPGQMVTVSLSFKNNCTSGAALAIPWTIAKNNQLLGSGTVSSVAPGQSVTVTAQWKAIVGTHFFYGDVDQTNTLAESSTYRANNISRQIDLTVNANWTAVRDRTKTAMTSAVGAWTTDARLIAVAVNSSIASGGRVAAPDLQPLLVAAMTDVPPEIAVPIARALARQWKSWSGTISVPGLPWYPPFIAWPGSEAVPMANVPTPFLTLAQNRTYLESGALATAMRNELGTLASFPNADAAITEIANWTAASTLAGATMGQVTLVMGKGPVPTFAPPYVPVGPVVGGSATQAGPLSTLSLLAPI